MADHASTSQGQAANTSSKFRAYAKEIEKALKFFETTTEWADLISALTKLCNVLQKSSKNFSEIPKSVVVAKRLSQCLHPALPSGVHLKALEVYKQLFTILQRGDNMSKELYLYAIGLFPLMDHCGIKVKSELLTIFEQFFLPMGDSLKPSLPGFIATVLIALEEGTEFFPRANDLLLRLIEAVGNEAFFSSLWEAVLHSPSVRLPALYFVNTRFDKRKPLGEQFISIAGGDHVDHMIAALCAVAEDFSGPVLMHRHLLDFLLSAFPLNSAHVTQSDFVQLLRRCLFIVLRRDMSLTRRIYQWLLNKSSDSAATILPTDGEEEAADIRFFDTYSLPLVKLSIVEFLKLDTVEVPMAKSVIGSAGGAYEGPKEHVIQYTEVRLCRALQYFLDRPPFGAKILEEVLAIFLEYCCIQDQSLATNLTKKCEELDSLFSPDWTDRVEGSSPTLTDAEKEKRLDEIRKNMNALLNNLEVGYLWKFLCNLFKRLLDSKYKNESDEEDMNLTDEERQKRDFREEKRKEHIILFPVMVAFCLEHVQLDNHSDIRSLYLPELLHTILSSITQHGCDRFTRDNLVALICVSRMILQEINQSSVSIETGVRELEASSESLENPGTFARSISAYVSKHKIEEQKLIENCFKSCYKMVESVCNWYIAGRDRDKTGVLCAASAFLRDFGDFPIYCCEDQELDALSLGEPFSSELPGWVKQLLKVIDVASWQAGHVADFDVRSRIVDLLIFLYIRSVILVDQHNALLGRDSYDFSKTSWASTKTTTTVLLKPMLSEGIIRSLDSSKIFENVSKVLWYTLSLSEEAGEHQTAACLLHRLHSRNTNDSSSDVEATIVADLTANEKSKCSEACRRFRKLWTLTRSSCNENVYDAIPYKSFNKVIMVLLGTIADDSLQGRNSNLKIVATSWFIDCAKHGDLPRVFQQLGTMLLHPATARVSIQYMTIESRLTKETIKSLPSNVNCLSLVTANGRQALQHVLHDAATAQDFSPLAPVDCTTNSAWISDLKKHILAPPDNGKTFSDSMRVMPPTPAPIKSHKRTISDIPQFDEDNESLGEISIEMNIDPDVVDCVSYLIDVVCDEIEDSEYVNERFKQAARDFNIAESSVELPSDNKFMISSGGSPTLQREVPKDTSHYRRSLPAAFPSQQNGIDKHKNDDQSKSLLIESSESLASKVPAQPPLRLPDNIKRVKCGHRRQDSLQESIFSTPTQDLRLFDPSELPKLTAPGDDKQPLLEEAQAHMLLYMESPDMVNLRQAEMVFRILSSLIRSNRGAALGKMMVHCMVFNNTSTSHQTTSGGVNQLIEYINRHYKTIQGEDFWLKLENNAEGSKPRHCSYFELFCTIALHYLRSYFLNSPISPVSENDLTVSWDCKIAALDFFTDLLREVIVLINDIRSRELVNSILTIYRQTKLQRCLISFLLTAVPTPRTPTDVISVSADIAEFNTRASRNNFDDTSFAYQRALLDFASIVISLEYQMNIGLHIYSEQNIPLSIEKSFVVHKLNYNSTQSRATLRDPRVLVVELKLFISVIVNALQKLPGRHELWLQFLVNILPFLEKALPTICIHVVDQLCRNIDTCVTCAYGYTGATTFDNASIAEESLILHSPRKRQASLTANTDVYPENYSLIAMEALTTIMHYSMLEPQTFSSSSTGGGVITTSSMASTSIITPVGGSPTHSVTPSSVNSSQNLASSSGNTSGVVSAINMIPGTKGATEMIGNLFNKVFTSNDASSSLTSSISKYDQKSAIGIWMQAKNELLKKLPQSLSTICDVWAVAQKGLQPRLPIGTAEQLKQRVFDLINPIAKRHPNALLNALSIVWMSRAQKTLKPDSDQLSFTYSEEQLTIANLLLELKVLPFQHAIFSLGECMKDLYKSAGGKTSTVTASPNDRTTVCEIAMLELLHGCVRMVPAKDLHDCWSALNFLFSEISPSVLSPRGVFLEFKILDDFVRICGSQMIVEDKQVSKGVLDACQRLTDAVNIIVGWQLETTSWLKRTIVVRQDTGSTKSGETTPMMETKSLATSLATAPETASTSIRGSTMSLATRDTRYPSHFDVSGGNSASQLVLNSGSQSSGDKKSSSNLRASLKDTNNNKRDPAYSTQALFLLAECLAELIDSITKSEDKEKLLPSLQAVWINTLPYLRVKNARNARFFLASSQFLASISSFSYMRSVWKKSALDLLFDPSFFKMDIQSLKQWLVVIDNLMTNEKACFKELMARIPTTPTTGITSLMTNKDQEYEIRAQSLKRLAFVLLSSQMEQYGSQLPDIQERLSDNLRLSQVPVVHAQVFTCFRVLLIRFPSLSFVSIWPPMATELVQVLCQMESQLQNVTSDTASMASSNDESKEKTTREEQWMQLYLSACKLLETLCTLPSGYVSQFQTCHWAFISSLVTDTTNDPFVPFAVRIHKLLQAKYGCLSPEEQRLHSASLQNIKTLISLSELRPFFHALASQHMTVVAGITGNTIQQECFLHDAASINGSMTLKNSIARLEHSLYVDFAEHLQL